MSRPPENFRQPFFYASVLVAIICIFPFAVTAQTVPCKVSLSSLPAAPELKGFHLGMTMEQAKAHVPQIVFGPTDLLGSSKTTINPGFDPRADKSKFQDVRSISLDFLDGRLVSLWIGYDSNFKWTGVPEFVAGISQSLSLPNAWTEWKLRGRQMRCTDFELTVTTVAQSPSFRIVDSAAEETLVARRNAAAEEAEAMESEPEAESESEEASEPEEIIADRKTKTYYSGPCRPAVPIAEANRITFKTTAEAEKAGYKLSRACS
ncbi:MAG: hypothetical protein M3447_01085 [Acidobacteriota bacterium]|nr:hypothetical protein [Acidobacteriota bacterium]